MTRNNHRKNLVSQLRGVNNRIQILSERLYNPELGRSETKELNKRRKKLVKTKEKLEKKLDTCETEQYNK
jgi:hypothetical protein|tara:strand:- start:548 stop:757 length:210 start_codon:yes stop_codon:yes gene_type:complete